MSVHEDSSGSPGESLGTLTSSSELRNLEELIQFTATGGIDLAPKTTYHVVVDVSSGNSNTNIRPTSSDEEDLDGQRGWEWGIADGRRYRTNSSTGAWTSAASALKIAIHGYPKLPAAPSTTVNGNTLTMLFGYPLREDHVPSVDAFTITLDAGARRIPVSEVSILGQSVTLTLEEPIGSHINQAWLRYDPRKAKGPQNIGKPLRSKWIINPHYYVDRYWIGYLLRDVTIVTPDTPPVVRELTVRHSVRPENQQTVILGVHRAEDLPVERWSILDVVLNEPMDANTLPDGSAFTVTARPPDGGSAVTVSGTDDTVTSDGHYVISMELAEPVARDAEVTVSYVKPSENALRDLTLNDLENFSGMAATNVDRGMAEPEVVSVAVVSDPGPDLTYRWGEKIRVQVTFSGDVLVSGTPRLRFSMGRGSYPAANSPRGGDFFPYAEYEGGSETRTLTFAYTVKELDRSVIGIAVEDRLELNGGAIWSWLWPGSSETNPDLSFPDGRVSHDANHKVEGRAAGLPERGGGRVDADDDLRGDRGFLDEPGHGLDTGAGGLPRHGEQRPAQRRRRRRRNRRRDGDAHPGLGGDLRRHGQGALHEAVRQPAAERPRLRRGYLHRPDGDQQHR